MMCIAEGSFVDSSQFFLDWITLMRGCMYTYEVLIFLSRNASRENRIPLFYAACRQMACCRGRQDDIDRLRRTNMVIYRVATTPTLYTPKHPDCNIGWPRERSDMHRVPSSKICPSYCAHHNFDTTQQSNYCLRLCSVLDPFA